MYPFPNFIVTLPTTFLLWYLVLRNLYGTDLSTNFSKILEKQHINGLNPGARFQWQFKQNSSLTLKLPFSYCNYWSYLPKNEAIQICLYDYVCTSSMRNQYPKKWTRKKAMMNLVVCHSSVLHAAWNEFDAKICISRLPWRHHFMHPVWISLVSLSSCLIAPRLHLLNPFRCDSLWTGDLLAIEISKTSTAVDEIFTNVWGKCRFLLIYVIKWIIEIKLNPTTLVINPMEDSPKHLQYSMCHNIISVAQTSKKYFLVDSWSIRKIHASNSPMCICFDHPWQHLPWWMKT